MTQPSPTRLLVATLALVLAAGLVAGAVPAHARPSLDRLQSQLSLTDDQVQAIRQLHQAQRPAHRQLRTSLREARHALRDLVLTGTDDAAIQAKTAEVQQLVAQAIQMRVDGLRAMSQILTPEQREAFRQLRPGRH